MVTTKNSISIEKLFFRVASSRSSGKVPSYEQLKRLAEKAKGARTVFALLTRKSLSYVSYIHRFKNCLDGCKDSHLQTFCSKCRKLQAEIKALVFEFCQKIWHVSHYMSRRLQSISPAVLSEKLSLTLLLSEGAGI